jgi:hypothetical protein
MTGVDQQGQGTTEDKRMDCDAFETGQLPYDWEFSGLMP